MFTLKFYLRTEKISPSPRWESENSDYFWRWGRDRPIHRGNYASMVGWLSGTHQGVTALSLRAISLPPASGKPPTHLLVTLHGWGANAEDLAPLVGLFDLPSWQFCFPDAPFAHYQVPGGRAWYALESPDYTGVDESRQRLRDWLLSLEQVTQVPLSCTAIAGFSQGGAMALDVGLTLPVAAICCLSGYLHPLKALSPPLPPVLLVHGRQDPVVPLQAARQAKEALTAAGVAVAYQEFEMGHEVTPAVIATAQTFLAGLTA